MFDKYLFMCVCVTLPHLHKVTYIYFFLMQDILTEINPETTDRGNPIIQGDIVVPPGKTAEDFKGIINPATFWTNGRVSYNFHSCK